MMRSSNVGRGPSGFLAFDFLLLCFLVFDSLVLCFLLLSFLDLDSLRASSELPSLLELELLELELELLLLLLELLLLDDCGCGLRDRSVNCSL